MCVLSVPDKTEMKKLLAMYRALTFEKYEFVGISHLPNRAGCLLNLHVITQRQLSPGPNCFFPLVTAADAAVSHARSVNIFRRRCKPRVPSLNSPRKHTPIDALMVALCSNGSACGSIERWARAET